MGALLVIVPALNEEAAIAGVVSDSRRALGARVLVIDDGSTDDTGAEARKAGAIVVRHPFNLGVGAAVRTGLRYAVAHGYETVVQLDGDGQHDPDEASILVKRLEEGDVDIVVGSRFEFGYSLSPARRIVMRGLASIVSRRLGAPITDTTSGFRAFAGPAVGYFSRVYPTDYLSDTVEALLLAADAGLRAVEVPVHMRRRLSGRPSAGSLRASFHVVRLLLVVTVHRFRPKLIWTDPPPRDGSVPAFPLAGQLPHET